MEFLEKDLEDILFQAYQNGNQSEIEKRGLHTFKHDYLVRQLNLGSYGIADLVGIKLCPSRYKFDESFSSITIYELKKGEINLSTFNQIVKYGKAIIDYMSSQGIYGCYVNYVIIGRKINPNADNLWLLNDAFKNVKTYTYNYDFEGVKFNYNGNDVYKNGNVGVSLSKYKKILIKMYALKKREQELEIKEQESITINQDGFDFTSN